MRLLKLALAALLVVATAVFAAGAIAERSQADTHAGPATHEEPAAGHREGGEEARAGESLRVGGNADTNEGLLGVDTESAPLIVLAVMGGLGLVAAFQPGQEFGRVLAA